MASTGVSQGHRQRRRHILFPLRFALGESNDDDEEGKKRGKKPRRQISSLTVSRTAKARDISFALLVSLTHTVRILFVDVSLHPIMSSKSSASSGLQQAFDKYSKFGKTHAQLADHNTLRIGSAGIQKMMKDCSLINTKYTSQFLDNDIARVLGKLTTAAPTAGTLHYPKGT